MSAALTVYQGDVSRFFRKPPVFCPVLKVIEGGKRESESGRSNGSLGPEGYAVAGAMMVMTGMKLAELFLPFPARYCSIHIRATFAGYCQSLLPAP